MAIAMLVPTNPTSILNLYKSAGIRAGQAELHVTIAYNDSYRATTRQECGILAQWGQNIFDAPEGTFKAKVGGAELIKGKYSSFAVLSIECQDAEDMAQQYLASDRYTSEYPKYNCHMTIVRGAHWGDLQKVKHLAQSLRGKTLTLKAGEWTL